MAANLYDLYGDEPTAEEQAQALAQAIRGQRQAAGLNNAVGELGVLSGDNVMSQYGQGLMHEAAGQTADATKREDMLGDAGKARLGLARAMAEKNAKNANQTAADLAARGAFAAKYPDVWKGLSPDLQQTMPERVALSYMQQLGSDKHNATSVDASNQHAAATNAVAQAMLANAQGSQNLQVQKTNQDLSSRMPAGWEPVDKDNPQIPTADEAKAFKEYQTAGIIVKKEVEKANEILKRGEWMNPLSSDARQLKAVVTRIQQRGLKTEAINNMTESHRHMMDDIASADTSSLKNYLNPEAMKELIDEMADSADFALDVTGKTLGLQRAKPGSKQYLPTVKAPEQLTPVSKMGQTQPAGNFNLDDGPAASGPKVLKKAGAARAPPAAGTPPKQGYILVSNGKESHWIDPVDEKGAAADGFVRKSK